MRSTGVVLSSTPENFRERGACRSAANYHWNKRWTFRGGLAFDQSPVRDAQRTPRLPDNDRTWVALGAQYRFTATLRVDLALRVYLHQGSEHQPECGQHGGERIDRRQLQEQREHRRRAADLHRQVSRPALSRAPRRASAARDSSSRRRRAPTSFDDTAMSSSPLPGSQGRRPRRRRHGRADRRASRQCGRARASVRSRREGGRSERHRAEGDREPAKLEPSPLATADRADGIEAANYDQHLAAARRMRSRHRGDLRAHGLEEGAVRKSRAARRANAIFASNTSGLSINALARSVSGRPAAALLRHALLQSAALHAPGRADSAAAHRAGLLDQLETFLVTTLGKGVVRARTRPTSSPTASASSPCWRRWCTPSASGSASTSSTR